MSSPLFLGVWVRVRVTSVSGSLVRVYSVTEWAVDTTNQTHSLLLSRREVMCSRYEKDMSLVLRRREVTYRRYG